MTGIILLTLCYIHTHTYIYIHMLPGWTQTVEVTEETVRSPGVL